MLSVSEKIGLAIVAFVARKCGEFTYICAVRSIGTQLTRLMSLVAMLAIIGSVILFRFLGIYIGMVIVIIIL